MFGIGIVTLKRSFSGLILLLTPESSFKMMKIFFYSMLKAHFVLGRIFTFLTGLFGFVEKTA